MHAETSLTFKESLLSLKLMTKYSITYFNVKSHFKIETDGLNTD